MILMVFGPGLISRSGILPGILGLVWAVAIARAMRTLAVVYHPVAADQLASADPAQRLSAKGQDRWATRIMGRSLVLGALVVCTLLGLGLFASGIAGQDMLKPIIKSLNWLMWPAIAIWLFLTVARARNKWETVLIFIASGALGVVGLMHPSVRGYSQAMTPVLTGLFGIPVLLMALFQGRAGQGSLPPEAEIEPSSEVVSFGVLAGLLSVVLPGLGTSSLVSAGEKLTKSDGDYLALASTAESVGELFALILGILAIAKRSSDAAVIGKLVAVATNGSQVAFGPAFPYLLLALMLMGTLAGNGLVKVVGPAYRTLITWIPQRLQALVVGTAMLWVVWTHSGAWGLQICLAGTLIHLGARWLRVPNQPFFAALVAPMVLSMLGVDPWSIL